MKSVIGLVAVLFASAAWNAGACGDRPAEQQSTRPRRAQCWNTSAAVQNTDVGTRQLPMLPSELASKPVKRHAVALRLCIDEKGTVARSIVVVSSGNTDVDAFYQRTAEKWKMKPASRGGKAVPSTADISASWTAR
jgi:TonB family protein